MAIIEKLRGLEILDSRGRPTVQVACRLKGGAVGTASVPSGASSGTTEAHELRDGDPDRYGGLGCRKAVHAVEHAISNHLAGKSLWDQEDLDRALIDLDGTPNKSQLGANAILAVSIAFAKASALKEEKSLYRYFADLAGIIDVQLPRPTINLFSGGMHAGKQVPIQDVLVVPASAATIDEALAHAYAIFQAAARLAADRFDYRLLRADEGGLAPPFEQVDEMMAMAVEAIDAAGFKPGKDVFLAVDVAASHFFEKGRYRMGEDALSSREMIDEIEQWVSRYPVVSLEDGLAEEDWDHWPDLKERISDKARVVGDDLLCTNPQRIDKAVARSAADTLLLKVNQIGTLSEAALALRKAREAGWQVTVSARSGETEDNWLADLAVGWAGNQIKVGSITQSERLAKYNRLLEIERREEFDLESWPREV